MKTRLSDSRTPANDFFNHTRETKTMTENDSESSSFNISDTNENLNFIQQKSKRNLLNYRSRRKSSKEISKSSNPENERVTEVDSVPDSKHNLYQDDKAKDSISNPADSDNSNLNNNSSQSRKSGEKKGRNLDLVLRRMLKAKKENEKQLESCDKNEIKSASDQIKPGVDEISCERNLNNAEGMIEVQLATSTRNHIQESSPVGFPIKSSVERRHSDSPSRDVIHDSCSSRSSDSPGPTLNSDSEPSVKPFVQRNTEDERKSMSPIIKQEPVSTLDSRLAMYHNNGPVETHSPSSSYGSQPSPVHRSPSPSSPGGRNSSNLPSPPELIMHSSGPQESHMSPSSRAAVHIMNGSVSSYLPTMIPPQANLYSRHSPSRLSPRSMMSSIQYGDDIRRSPGVTAAAMAASGIGLPTLVPAMSAIPQNGPPPIFHLGENSLLQRQSMIGHYSDAMNMYTQQRRNVPDSRGPKVSPNAPTGPNPPRGIVGQKEAAAAGVSRSGNGGRRGGNNVDEKCPYKRPPHTYPALIASAILDSPGNLITLRGIYDYIMNNFPYYKFGHDKSAWQNSIRHNLSLNQCFVKVPRYENAAKSNYWTMTREGFEEFGNENSFKRRRRRGAALAPISAYKNKKYGTHTAEGNGTNRVAKQRTAQGENNPMQNGGAKGVTAANYMNWGGRSRTPEPNLGYNVSRDHNGSQQGVKRAGSPGVRLNGNLAPKHPRMVVLKQGEGPALEGLGGRNDHPQRPNSLSSVEEMQGNLNSFSKSLSGATDGTSAGGRSPRHNQGRNSPLNNINQPISQQQWMMAAAAAAQKNLYTAGLFPPGLIPTSNSTPPPLVPPSITSSDSYPIQSHASAIDVQSKLAGLGATSTPVMMDHIEVGSQVPLFIDSNGSISTWSFGCRFCEYKYIDESSALLEQHCRLIHPLEMTNAKAKAVAAAAVAGSHHDHECPKSPIGGQDPGSLMSLQSMVSGFSPSMLAAAAGYNAQNILAAAHAAGISLPGSVVPTGSISMSNPVTSTPPYFTDPLMRSLAQQMGTGSGDQSNMVALNSALQQAAMNNATGASSLPQDQQQIRQMLYQQILMQNPFFSGNQALAAAMPRQMPGARNDMSTFAQLWQYQQKMLEMTSQNANGKTSGSEDGEKIDSKTKQSPNSVANRKSPTRNRKSSSSSNSSGHDNGANDEKQVNIHGWKQCQDCDFTAKGAHGLGLHFRKAHARDSCKTEENKTTEDMAKNTTSSEREEASKSEAPKLDSKILDLSGTKTSDMTSSNESDVPYGTYRSSSGTQTEIDEADTLTERRSCRHCDVTFGDDTMHALHMSCHDRNDPFKCTICGQECHEKYYFNVHLLRGLHQPTQNKKLSRDDGSEVKFVRRHSNTSEKSISSTCSEGRNVTAGTAKDVPKRSPSSVSLPEVTSFANDDVSDDMTSHA